MNKIAAKYGTPTYVYSEAHLAQATENFTSALRWYPNHQICYAMKANSNPHILSTLRKQGIGADIVSGGELELALRAKIAPSKILFSGVGKTQEEIDYAVVTQIRAFNVECEDEIEKLERASKRFKKPVSFHLRANLDVDAKTHRHISTGKKENKFGLTEKAIHAIIQNLNRGSAHSKVMLTGLSIHIGSQIFSIEPYLEAYTKLCTLVRSLENKHGISLPQLDLGGGFGVDYTGSGRNFNLEQYAQKTSKLFRKLLDPNLTRTYFFEPGRSLVATSGTLLTRVVSIKRTDSRMFVILDTGMNHLIRPALYGSIHPIEVVSLKTPTRTLRKVTVVGPICESSDVFATDIKLPSTLQCGDLLAITAAGAYGYSMASFYNARDLPAEIWLGKDEKSRSIRKRLPFPKETS